MRVLALLATYNEERYIAANLEHLFRQGCDAYLIDNESTDRTLSIAESYLGRGLVGIETISRCPYYSHRAKLERKEVLAATLDADWFMHMDADEFRLPPRSDQTLAQAFEQADAHGYNAVHFLEFVFIPTLQAPDHDHPDFQKTMRWYYHSRPLRFHRLNAWKRQPGRVDLASSGGHTVQFDGRRICPEPFRMRHYHFLSVPHAVTKLVGRPYDPVEKAAGWHTWRASIKPEDIHLPSESELRVYTCDDELDVSDPWPEDWLEIVTRDRDPALTRRRMRVLQQEREQLIEQRASMVAQYGERQHAIDLLAAQLADQTQKVTELIDRVGEQQRTIAALTAESAKNSRMAQGILAPVVELN
ncbi:MAG: glycosyltransferase family 2 protein, partial [Chloroflexi bacterium]|nr:glycosyltransferase family 2 protein [Chloroflexota bacterium]